MKVFHAQKRVLVAMHEKSCHRMVRVTLDITAKIED